MSATDTEAALLAAILHAPADDGPRLVYADWLEERGETDRAEFVRVQCELDSFRYVDAVRGCAVRGCKYDARDGISPEWQRAFDLHEREMRLLWAGPSQWQANWVNWCWCERRDDEGRPMTADGRGGMVVTPHGSPGLGNDPQSCGIPVSGGGIVRQIFRRGFVSTVRAPLGVLLGGPCGRCAGTGWRRGNTPATADALVPGSPCPDCHGTPGTLAALFRSCPITAVEASDREPYWNGGGYCWFDPERRNPNGSVPAAANLPADLYAAVAGHDASLGVARWRAYPTADLARSALSAALVRLGRTRAGLPKLEGKR